MTQRVLVALVTAYAGAISVAAQATGPQGTAIAKYNVWLDVQKDRLTVNRSGGSMNVIASVSTTPGQYSGTKEVTVSFSALANPSGVALERGAAGHSCKLTLAAGQSKQCSFTVTTKPDRDQDKTTSGTMTTSAIVRPAEADLAEVAGSPREITIRTQP